MRIIRKAAIGLLAVAIVATLPGLASGAKLTLQTRANRAAAFIADGQNNNGSLPSFSAIGSTADAVIALTAANRGTHQIRKAIRYLGNQVADDKVTSVGLRAKVALAAIAANKDPHTFGGQDLIALIEATEEVNGRYGAGTAVFDQAGGILAIEGSGGNASAEALAFLAEAQCPDGGWAYDEPYNSGSDDEHCSDGGAFDFFTSDTNTTALAVQALEAGNGPATGADPFDFFEFMRDDTYGGWGFTQGFDTTDANSTAHVLMAYYAAGETPPNGAAAALRKLQYNTCGALSYSWVSAGVRTGPDLGATVGALPALMKRFHPMQGKVVTKPAAAVKPCPA